MRCSTRVPGLIAAALALTGVAHAGDVVVVDPAGGSGVALLQAAILAAKPGDTLLLADGDYLGPLDTVYTVKKGVALLVAPGAGRPDLRRLDINSIPAGQTLVLRGVDIGNATSPGGFPPLHVLDNPGAVWLEDCDLRGNDAVPKTGLVPQGGQAAAMVGVSSEVWFRHCRIAAGRGADAVPAAGIPFSGAGGIGLIVDADSEVALHDCVVLGGDGGNGPAATIFKSGCGGDALGLDGDATIAGCTLVGGAEGADNDAQPGTSGTAITTEFAAADVRVLSSTLTPGAVQGAGTVAQAIVDPPHKVLLLSTPARSLVLPDQLREGQTGTLAIDGEPGDLASIFLSADATLTPLLGQKGTLGLDLATLQGPIVLGSLPGPDGVLDVPFTLPALPPGVEAVTVYVQGVFVAGGDSALGGASALTWIDAAH